MVKAFKKLPKLENLDSFEFRNICFSYEGSQKNIFEQLSFTFPTDCNASFCAEDGSGKSSLMSLFALLLNPKSGQYLINGTDVSALSFDEVLKYRLNVGYSFENEGLLSNQTLEANLLLALRYHQIFSEEQVREAVSGYLDFFELKKYKDERPANVPFKFRKLISLIRSLVHQPQLLILDEPTMGLAPKQVDNLIVVLQSLKELGVLKHFYFSSTDPVFNDVFKPVEIHLAGGQLELISAKKAVA